MVDDQEVPQVETPAGQAEQSTTTGKTEPPANEPKAELEVDVDEQETEAVEADEEQDEEGERPKRKSSGIHRLKAENARLQAELARAKQFVPAQADAGAIDRAVEARIGAPPKESDYPDYLAFERAQTAYEVDRRQTQRVMREEAAQSGQREAEAAQAAFESHNDRVKEARKILPDYDAKVKAANFSVLAPEVARMCVESGKSATIAYYLASNPKVLGELSQMDPVSAARRIGRIEASVRLPKPETQSRAPAPPTKLPGGGAPPASDAHKAQSMADYAKIRKAEMGWD